MLKDNLGGFSVGFTLACCLTMTFCFGGCCWSGTMTGVGVVAVTVGVLLVFAAAVFLIVSTGFDGVGLTGLGCSST